jgi:homoserine O-acetyltransferase
MNSFLLRHYGKKIRCKSSVSGIRYASLSASRSHIGSQARRRFSKGMQDEYGEMTAEGETFAKNRFILENGCELPLAQLRYQTYGQLNDERDNVVVICHALTGNASLHSWWGGLLGKNLAFDTNKYFVVCCNILGSCYGSTHPRSANPDTGTVYGKLFPDVSVRDTVKLQLHLLQEELQISSVKSVIGGSFGGMQAMEYAVQAGSSGSEFLSADGKT